MQDAIKLDGGKLTLFKRNGLWQARIYVGDRRYLWRSLKTPKQVEARAAGMRLLHETQFKQAQGLPVTSRSFNAVIDEYVAWRQRDHEVGRQVPNSSTKHTSAAMLRQVQRVVKFWREYAGTRAIDAVDDRALRDYLPWRRAYYTGVTQLPKNAKLHPTDKTLQWEIMLGKALIKFAHEQGYRGSKPLPTWSFTPKVKRVRPAFTVMEYRQLYRVMRQWAAEPVTEAWSHSRQLLRDYVLILANSGLRVGEANSLQWRDVVPFVDEHGRKNVQLHVRGKTGQRVVIPRVRVAIFLDRLSRLYDGADSGDLVFRMRDGSAVTTLIDQFNAVLALAGLTHNSAGEKYTLYSLRHFYAVQALTKGIDIYTVARNMGTSVKIIEDYYGRHATPVESAGKLGGRVRVV
jgi:integrase